MDRRITTKDLPPIDGKVFRLNKMDVRLSCWLFTVFAGRAEEDKGLLSALGKLTHSEFDEVQSLALSYVQLVDTSTEIPLVNAIFSNGIWADKELAKDPNTVMKLTTASIMFNIEPFLEEKDSNV